MWDVEPFNKLCFCMSRKYYKDAKSDANKQDFENKLSLTCQAQSPPKNNMDINQSISTICPNLLVLALTGGELSRGQAQNGVILTLTLDLTLKVNVNDPLKQ